MHVLKCVAKCTSSPCTCLNESHLGQPLPHRPCRHSFAVTAVPAALAAMRLRTDRPLHCQFPTSTAHIQLFLLSSSRCMASPSRCCLSSTALLFCLLLFSADLFSSSFLSAPPCRQAPSVALRSRLVSPRLQAAHVQCASPLPLLLRWCSSSSICSCHWPVARSLACADLDQTGACASLGSPALHISSHGATNLARHPAELTMELTASSLNRSQDNTALSPRIAS